MTLNPIKANLNELKLGVGLTVLFSYRTPVACYWLNANGGRQFYKTEKKWSATTTWHVNSWVERPSMPETKPQEYFDGLVK